MDVILDVIRMKTYAYLVSESALKDQHQKIEILERDLFRADLRADLEVTKINAEREVLDQRLEEVEKIKCEMAAHKALLDEKLEVEVAFRVALVKNSLEAAQTWNSGRKEFSSGAYQPRSTGAMPSGVGSTRASIVSGEP